MGNRFVRLIAITVGGVIAAVGLLYLLIAEPWRERPGPSVVSQPAATSAPAPTAAPAKPGGLGLTRTEWETAHGSGTADPVMGQNYGGSVIVLFQNDPAGADTLWNIEQRWRPGISVDDARVASKLLIPADSKFVRTLKPMEGRVVDVYTSEWLKARFPASLWHTGKPGDFTVLYHTGTGSAAAIIISLGDNPL